MELTLNSNPLYKEKQTLQIDRVATLIGENGSGKSCILQSLFEQKLNQQEHLNHLRVICFSSGQNENFSDRFGRYLSSMRKKRETPNLDCFYYDKSWSKLLIFLATSMYGKGHVRRFLREGGYVKEEQTRADTRNEDVSTKLSFKFRIPRDYSIRVQEALKQEEGGNVDTLRATPYFRALESFTSVIIDRDYVFDKPLGKTTCRIAPQNLFDLSFEGYPSGVLKAGWPAGVLMKNMGAVSFFTQASDNNYFIEKKSMKLYFDEDLEMDFLSDGEYQLLFLYALIDLFDSPDTLFLLDEADSHLHYANVDRLWKVLGSIHGKAITTTHLLDSITANDFHDIKVVERGRISENDKLKQLIDRLKVLSRASSVEYEICAKLKYMALMDDYNDWKIFRSLAERKGLDVSRMDTVYAFKKVSSYENASENFGQAKIRWLENLGKVDSGISTAQVFLICDRDEAPLKFDPSGVTVCGKDYQKKIKSIRWSGGVKVKVHLLAWKRREIKNYLLSYTALEHHKKLDVVNGHGELGPDHRLKPNDPGDNNGIRCFRAKPVVDSLVNEERAGFSVEKLQAYVDLIPPEEISEDIENMYRYIVSQL